MGKPFAKELLHLPSTFEWAAAVEIAALERFFAAAKGHPLVIVGAGGSYTAAEFARQLHEDRGGLAVAYTPLSFLESKTDLRRTFVLIYTAGGSNPDVLSTFDAAVAREPLGVFVLCARRKSKVELRVADAERATVMVAPLPTGKDGYLATNSLASFLALTLRAFGHTLPSSDAIQQALKTSWTPKLPNTSPVSFLALYGDWARPAAVDLESKLSEAALGGAMLADYRHFAHGRHNWINKRGAGSVIVAFITPGSRTLAERTLALLPKSTHIIRLMSPVEGAGAVLPLVCQVFAFISWIGSVVGIDPGRPGIPSYGSRIYHLGPQRPRTRIDTRLASVGRKLAARGTLGSSADSEVVAEACDRYRRKLSGAAFRALIADFDGTIISPGQSHTAILPPTVKAFLTGLLRKQIPLYFATGRGDSIAKVLRNSLDRKFHDRVVVSYYNGGLTQSLTADVPAPEEVPSYSELEALRRDLLQDPVLAKQAVPENKGYQLTLKAKGAPNYAAAAAVVRELVASAFPGKMKVVESSHSLDVIPQGSNKLNCLSFARGQFGVEGEFLTLGDRGALGGNDFDLLSHPFSLSVDTVSAQLTSCWNLLPPGCRNVAGLLHYAEWFKIATGRFELSIS